MGADRSYISPVEADRRTVGPALPCPSRIPIRSRVITRSLRSARFLQTAGRAQAPRLLGSALLNPDIISVHLRYCAVFFMRYFGTQILSPIHYKYLFIYTHCFPNRIDSTNVDLLLQLCVIPLCSAIP